MKTISGLTSDTWWLLLSLNRSNAYDGLFGNAQNIAVSLVHLHEKQHI
ncbi:MAG: hypothetical protein V7K47_07210 [Nostoc sp.]